MKELQTTVLEYYILDTRPAEYETGAHNHTKDLRFKQC